MDIKAAIGECEVLCQLAEEASELAQAALKLRRALDRTNPTPVPESEARERLNEEFADVIVCTTVLFKSWKNMQNTVDAKMKRWEERLRNAAT